MKRLALLLPVLLLAACTGTQAPAPSVPTDTDVGTVSSIEAASSSSAVATAPSGTTVTLVSQTFVDVSAKGLVGLQEMGVKKIKGHLDTAQLTLELKGNEKWGVVAMYFAPLLAAKVDAKGNVVFREGINPDQEWKHFRFIGATWNGDCHRHVSAKSFGAVGTEVANKTFDLSALPLTKGDDGCDTAQDVVDVLKLINDNGGGYIGFLTSPSNYTLKADLTYTGEATVTPLQ